MPTGLNIDFGMPGFVSIPNNDLCELSTVDVGLKKCLQIDSPSVEKFGFNQWPSAASLVVELRTICDFFLN